MRLPRVLPVFLAAMLISASMLTAQVVQTIDPVNPPDGIYSYAVKFVCGFQDSNTGLLNTPFGLVSYGEPTVKAGNYATDINIYNPIRDTEVEKRFLLLVEDGKPVGREPRFVRPSAEDAIGLPQGHATMDDCNRLAELLPPATPFSLRIGFLVLTSKTPLDVTAVYTAEICSDWTVTGAGRMCSSQATADGTSPFSSALSIDVEQIDAKFIPQ